MEQYRTFLQQVKEDMGTGGKMLDITGGEPLLRKEFFDIMGAAHELGFSWGMTSNATLIDDSVAKDLKKVGIGTISVSIDGLRESHDAFRRTPGGYDRAMKGIEALEAFFRSMDMPLSFRELGIRPTEEQLRDLARRCSHTAHGRLGSARVLREEDMYRIYKAAAER